jgi:hypothetical protein
LSGNVSACPDSPEPLRSDVPITSPTAATTARMCSLHQPLPQAVRASVAGAVRELPDRGGLRRGRFSGLARRPAGGAEAGEGPQAAERGRGGERVTSNSSERREFSFCHLHPGVGKRLEVRGCCRDNPPRKRRSVRAHPGQPPFFPLLEADPPPGPWSRPLGLSESTFDALTRPRRTCGRSREFSDPGKSVAVVAVAARYTP